MKNDDAILAELEALKTRIAALEASAGLVKPAAGDVARAKFVEREVSITHPIETSPIVLPTESEYLGILSAVRDAYPQLWRSSNSRFADQDDAVFFATFVQHSNGSRICAAPSRSTANTPFPGGWMKPINGCAVDKSTAPHFSRP